jgi:hypothetical protein
MSYEPTGTEQDAFLLGKLKFSTKTNQNPNAHKPINTSTSAWHTKSTG